jgi:flagellar basal-body rod modification protein FlgD
MDISAIAAAAPAASAPPAAPVAASSSGSTLDYNAFLKVRVAEVQNQEPTDPMDTSQYVAQFAGFANVEQGMQINDKLAGLMTSFALSQAEGVIGHTVTSADGATSGTVVSLTIGSDGSLLAKLDNGDQMILGPGVTIS